MSYTILENTKSNKIIYQNDKIYVNEFPEALEPVTWSFSSIGEGHDVLYTQVLAESQELSSCCPERLKDRFENSRNKLKACLKTYKEVKINSKEFSIIETIPTKFLLEFGKISCEIFDDIASTKTKQEYYQNLVNISEVVYDISKRIIKYDGNDFEKFKNKKRLKYNIFNGKTYRLSTSHDSFPMNIKKELRQNIVPTNDLLTEIDFNGMDIRVFIALMEQNQPEIDIHSYNQEILKCSTRTEAKQNFFAWFYDINKRNKNLENFYDRTFLLDKYVDNSYNIITPYKTEIKSDDFHWLSHLIQTTASFLFWDQLYKVYVYLKENRLKTFIKFLNHDSILLDVSRDELEHLKNIKSIFGRTRFGDFRTSLTTDERWSRLEGK